MANTTDNNLSLRQNLLDAACPADMIEQFITLGLEGKRQEQVAVLTAHRKALLGQIRQGQHALDCLDYLLFTMKKADAYHGT